MDFILLYGFIVKNVSYYNVCFYTYFFVFVTCFL